MLGWYSDAKLRVASLDRHGTRTLILRLCRSGLRHIERAYNLRLLGWYSDAKLYVESLDWHGTRTLILPICRSGLRHIERGYNLRLLDWYNDAELHVPSLDCHGTRALIYCLCQSGLRHIERGGGNLRLQHWRRRRHNEVCCPFGFSRLDFARHLILLLSVDFAQRHCGFGKERSSKRRRLPCKAKIDALIPCPLRENLKELLCLRMTAHPPIGVKLAIFLTEHPLKGSATEV